MSENTPTSNVVPLKTHPQIAREDVEDMLEALLERVRNGEVVSAAVAYVNVDGSVGTGVSECLDAGRLIGAATLLQYRLVSGAE